MGTNWSVACNKCEVYVDVGKRGPSGFSFWTAAKIKMELLRKMLENCTEEHPYALCFLNEHDRRKETFRDLDPEDDNFGE